MDVRGICRLLDRLDSSNSELERTSAQVMTAVTLMREDLPYLHELVERDLQHKMKHATRDR